MFDEASSWWSSDKKVLPDSNNIKETLQQKMGEQTVHIWSSVDAPEEPSNIGNDELDKTQPSRDDERKAPTPQLRRIERIPKPNPKYANAAILEDSLKEPEIYEEAS